MTSPVRRDPRALALAVALYDQLARFASFDARDVRSTAARETFRSVCVSALARGGVFGLARTCTAECADLLAVIIQSRLEARSAAPRVGISPWIRDLRLAARSLWSGRRTTAIAVATLALGIGVNAAVFSVLDATMWRQLPFRDATRLVEILNFSTEQKFSFNGFPRPLFQQWRQQTDLFDQIEGYQRDSFVYDAGRGAEVLAGATVTPATFRMLGVPAARGRAFVDDDGRDQSSAIAVVSDAFWREHLGATTDVLSRTVSLNGVTYQIVGVMPASFRFPTGAESVWVPYDLNRPPTAMPAPREMTALAHLAMGVTMPQAAAEVAARGSRLSVAAGRVADLTASLMQPGNYIDERTQRSLLVMSGAVAFLFLIVCANVANLTLSRSLSRHRVLATCAALGATPRDLMRATFLEQLLLAGSGMLGGLAVAAGAVRMIAAVLPDSMLADTLNVIDIDTRALAFMLAAAGLAALLFGLPPAFVAARTSLAGALSRDGRASAGSRPARRLRAALAIVEVAISVVLLIGAALMTRSFVKLAGANHGYDARNLVSLRLALPANGYKTDVGLRDRATQDIVDRIAALPDVTGVTRGDLPGGQSLVSIGTLATDAAPDATGPRLFLPIHEVPPNYFSVLGIPIVAGRTFRADDLDEAVLVSQRFASRYFPSGDAVGRKFRMGNGPWRMIIGVAGNTRTNTDVGDDRPEAYCAIGKATDASRPVLRASAIVDYRTVLIRTARPDVIMRLAGDAVHERDASIVIWKTALVEHLLGDAISRPRIVFMMMAVFAAFGLLLAMAGLYGVMSCLVAQRRQEIGVRMALGASSAQMRRLVLGNGLSLTGAGLAIGVLAALPLVRLMRSLLFEVSATDTLSVAGATLVLGVTAALACWWPAREAGRTNPVDLLRTD